MRYPTGRADAMRLWVAVFEAALEAPSDELAVLLAIIRDALGTHSRGTIEIALREVGLSVVSRITRTEHPELGDQAGALLEASGVPEMTEAAQRLRLAALSVRRLLMYPLLADTYLQLAPSFLDPEQRRMELADLAVDVITAAEYLLSLLGAASARSSQLVLAAKRTLTSVGSADDAALDRLARRRLDARGTAVRLGMRLLIGLGYGSANSAEMTLPDLRPLINVVAEALPDKSQIDSILAMSGLSNVRYPTGRADAMRLWVAVFEAALEAPSDELAALLAIIRDALGTHSRGTIEIALREVGLSVVSRITRTEHPELGDQAGGLLEASGVPEMTEAAQRLRLAALSGWRLLMYLLLADTYLQLAPSFLDPEQRLMELADLAVDVITAAEYLLSLLGAASARSSQLVLAGEADSTSGTRRRRRPRPAGPPAS